ncbi:MAG: hypothetical protein AAGA83_13185 [Cyanobacteria bacterium P01_F01_bin.116]
MGAEDTVTSRTGTSNINEFTDEHSLKKQLRIKNYQAWALKAFATAVARRRKITLVPGSKVVSKITITTTVYSYPQELIWSVNSSLTLSLSRFTKTMEVKNITHKHLLKFAS